MYSQTQSLFIYFLFQQVYSNIFSNFNRGSTPMFFLTLNACPLSQIHDDDGGDCDDGDDDDDDDVDDNDDDDDDDDDDDGHALSCLSMY